MDDINDQYLELDIEIDYKIKKQFSNNIHKLKEMNIPNPVSRQVITTQKLNILKKILLKLSKLKHMLLFRKKIDTDSDSSSSDEELRPSIQNLINFLTNNDKFREPNTEIPEVFVEDLSESSSELSSPEDLSSDEDFNHDLYNSTSTMTFMSNINAKYFTEKSKKLLIKILNSPSRRKKFYANNELIKLLTIFPNVNWKWDAISCNPNINMRYISKNINKFDNCWDKICMNPNLTMKFIRKNINNIVWHYASKNSAITLQNIISNPDLPWDYEGLSNNPNMKLSYVLKHLDEDWNWYYLSRNKGISIYEIEKHPELPWNKNGICQNPTLNIEYVLKYSKDMNFTLVSENPGIKIEDIFKHPFLSWDYSAISRNPNLTLQHVYQYHYKPWKLNDLVNNLKNLNDNGLVIKILKSRNITVSYFESLAVKLCLDFDFIIKQNRPLDSWNWRALSESTDIENIFNHKFLEWDWYQVCKNPNLTFRHVMENLDLDLDFSAMSENLFGFHPSKENMCYI